MIDWRSILDTKEFPVSYPVDYRETVWGVANSREELWAAFHEFIDSYDD